jgi:hypothetical protein
MTEDWGVLEALREAHRKLDARLKASAREGAGPREPGGEPDAALGSPGSPDPRGAARQALGHVAAAIAALTATGPEVPSAGDAPAGRALAGELARDLEALAPLSAHAPGDLPRAILDRLGADQLLAELHTPSERPLATAIELAGMPKVEPAAAARQGTMAGEPPAAAEASVTFLVRGPRAPLQRSRPSAQGRERVASSALALQRPDPPIPVEEAEITIIERGKPPRE